MRKNYELIYRVKEARLNTDSPKNIENRLCNEARAEAARLHKQYADFLQGALGKDVNLEFTSTVCMADGIISHVYTWKGNEPKGLGKRVCCLCGHDDFDD